MSYRPSAEAEKRLDEIIKRYPEKRSAAMGALYIAQEEIGFLNDDAIAWVSEKVGIAPVHVRELATFYSMYYQRKVGRYNVQICRTLSCAVRGAKELTACMRKRYGIKEKEVSKDGMWSYEEVECLGSCGSAPMCEINDHYFENLSPEKFEEILDRIEREKPDLKLSTVKDELGAGLRNHPKSEVL